MLPPFVTVKKNAIHKQNDETIKIVGTGVLDCPPVTIKENEIHK